MKRGLLILLVIALIVVLPALSPEISSFSAVTGTSMDPTLRQGDLIYYEKVPASSIETGDIIVFSLPGLSEKHSTVPSLVTHRVIEVRGEAPLIYRTRGDNNPAVDPWELSSDDIRGRVNLSISYLGFLVIFFKSTPGLVLLALMLLVSTLCLFSNELVVFKRRAIVKISSG